MKKRVTSMLTAIVIAFALLPTVAFADVAPDYISEYDAPGSWESTETYLAEENLSGNGWSWDAETRTLTLNGFQGAGINFGTYYGLKIVLAEGSTNKVNHLMLKPGRNGIVIEGTGELVVNHFDINPYDGPVTIASSLQLTGRRYGLDAQWEPLMIDNASLFPVTADGESTVYFRDFRISSSGLPTTTPTDPVSPAFTDVPQWCSAAVDWALDNNITNGTGDNKFSPDIQCKNSEILTFLWRAAGKPYPDAEAPIPLKGDEWYADAVRWAARKHMIGKDFDPDALCTRASALNFIFQGVSPNEINIPQRNSFADVPRNAYYGVAVDWAVTYGITNGTSSTTFGPDDTCTRGQIVTFLHRAYVPEARLNAK